MSSNHKPVFAVLNRRKFKRWSVCGIALISFGAGSVIAARLAHLNQVRADSDRVSELRVYHAVPANWRRWSRGFATRLPNYSPNTI
jgi:hypothetical protein